MKKRVNTEKLKDLTSKKRSTNWEEITQWHEDNHDSVELSTKFAVKVLKLLKQKSISQVALAEKMGVSPQFVSRIVKGRENLTFSTVQKIENALEVKIIDIVCNENPKEVNQTSSSEYFFIPLYTKPATLYQLDTNFSSIQVVNMESNQVSCIQIEPAKC